MLVHGEQFADLCRLAERCIEDVGLRARVIEVTLLSTSRAWVDLLKLEEPTVGRQGV